MIMNKKIDSEKLVERKLVESIRVHGGMCIKLLSDNFRGLPDRMVLLPNGNISFCELKTTGKKPTRVQKCVHNLIRKLGFHVEVIDTIEGVNNFINSISQ